VGCNQPVAPTSLPARASTTVNAASHEWGVEAAWAQKLYDPVVGLSGVIAVETTCDGCVVSRLGGAYFGVFFLGFFASRLRLSLFPIPNSMPRLGQFMIGNVRGEVSPDYRLRPNSCRSRY